MSRYETIVPLYLTCPSGTWSFGGGLKLQPMPRRILRDSMLTSLSEWDRKTLTASSRALVSRYDCAALGSPDPTYPALKRRSLQQTRVEHAQLAVMAIWLAKPSPVTPIAFMHGPVGRRGIILQQVLEADEFLCHPDNQRERVAAADLRVAVKIHKALIDVSRSHRDGSIWVALNALWAGFINRTEVIRYALAWVALEALMGPEGPGETVFQVALRIAMFVADDSTEAHALIRRVKDCYRLRSAYVHGRMLDHEELTEAMGQTETLLRRILYRILLGKGMLANSDGKRRDVFLAEMVVGPKPAAPTPSAATGRKGRGGKTP